jgi:hypothetical protein
LIRVREGSTYEGKTAKLFAHESVVSMQFLSGRKAGKDFYFSVATDKQKQKHDQFINQDKVSAIYPAVNLILRSNRPRTVAEVKLLEDWDRIITYTPTYNQARFDSTLNDFKVRHLAHSH